MSPNDFRALRLAAGLSQSGLARLWGIHVRTVSAWETGRRPVPEMAARLLDIEYARLLERTPK